jgi:opacity protein-like surface antigen
MKKTILLLFATIITLTVSGQAFGLKGGMALTNFSGDLEFDSRTGLFLGVFLKMGENNIQWSPEIIFHQKGATTKSDTLNLNYTEMGINAHFHINDELALTAGPYAGYAATTINKSNDKKNNKVGFGVNLGGSYAINDLFNIDIRYGIGLTDVLDKDKVNDNGNMQNTSLQIGIGYIFSY